MNYHDGATVRLGDIVRLPVPTGTARARVVMLGETYEHLDIDPQFISWVTADKVLRPDSVVVEWLNENPFERNDSRYAPVGQFMFTPIDEWIERDA